MFLNFISLNFEAIFRYKEALYYCPELQIKVSNYNKTGGKSNNKF